MHQLGGRADGGARQTGEPEEIRNGTAQEQVGFRASSREQEAGGTQRVCPGGDGEGETKTQVRHQLTV